MYVYVAKNKKLWNPMQLQYLVDSSNRSRLAGSKHCTSAQYHVPAQQQARSCYHVGCGYLREQHQGASVGQVPLLIHALV